MIIHHLSAATLCPIAGRLVNGHGPWLGRGRMVCHCWLVEAPSGLVLVDTGLGRLDLADMAGRLGAPFARMMQVDTDPSATAWEQIRRLGFDPADVCHIIPTYFDLDHIGGLSDFPGAQVHVFRPEYEAALAQATLADRQRYRPVQWAHGPHWDVREVGGEPWFGFRGVQAIDGVDDLLLVPLVGHSVGHVGVAARGQAGWELHAGDAYFAHSEVASPPSCPPGLSLFQRLVAYDDTARRANQRRLVELAETGEVKLHSAHCPVEFERVERR